MRGVVYLKTENDHAPRSSTDEADLNIYRCIGQNRLNIKNKRLTFQMKISAQTYLVHVKIQGNNSNSPVIMR